MEGPSWLSKWPRVALIHRYIFYLTKRCRFKKQNRDLIKRNSDSSPPRSLSSSPDEFSKNLRRKSILTIFFELFSFKLIDVLILYFTVCFDFRNDSIMFFFSDSTTRMLILLIIINIYERERDVN